MDKDLTGAESILRAIMSHPYVSLEDLIYHVREHEGKGWEGQAVTEWNSIAVAAKKWFKEDGEK